MTNGNAKGKRGEREAAELLRKHNFEARRGQQFAGGGDSPDVVSSMEGVHIEVKRTETLSIYSAVEQALKDKKEKDVPLVLHRRNGKPWLAIMLADDLLAILDKEVFK